MSQKLFNYVNMTQSSTRKLCAGLIWLFLLPNLAQAEAGERLHLRGQRYCEIILRQSLTSYSVYNTLGLNDCPQSIWQKITVASVKDQTHAKVVHLNGPRYWVIDGMKNSTLVNPKIEKINGLAMREAGVLKLSLLSLILDKPYQTHQVARHTTWVYQAGKPVYEIIDADKNVYVMQSYSIQKNSQTQKSLSQLGAKLNLPKGWIFKTGIIKKTDNLETLDGLAEVIQDDFQNTYQKASHDFLK